MNINQPDMEGLPASAAKEQHQVDGESGDVPWGQQEKRLLPGGGLALRRYWRQHATPQPYHQPLASKYQGVAPFPEVRKGYPPR